MSGQFQLLDSAAAWSRSIVIQADDGTELLRFTWDDGRLDVAGDESRWTEAASRFITEMRRMVGAGPSTIRLCSVCNTKCVGQWLD
jgi:hypothetical protein